jgi:hypothetical protein
MLLACSSVTLSTVEAAPDAVCRMWLQKGKQSVFADMVTAGGDKHSNSSSSDVAVALQRALQCLGHAMVLLDAGAWNGTAPTRALNAALQRFGDKRAKVRRAAQAAVVEVRVCFVCLTCTVCKHLLAVQVVGAAS